MTKLPCSLPRGLTLVVRGGLRLQLVVELRRAL